MVHKQRIAMQPGGTGAATAVAGGGGASACGEEGEGQTDEDNELVLDFSDVNTTLIFGSTASTPACPGPRTFTRPGAYMPGPTIPEPRLLPPRPPRPIRNANL